MTEQYLYFLGAAAIVGIAGYLFGSGRLTFGPLAAGILLCLILIPVAFNSFVWMYGTSARETLVPNVLGLSSSEAFSAVKDAGLAPEISGISFSKKAAGTVLSQRPPAGKKVKAGRTVEIVLSAMEKGTAVPNVVGLSRQAAEDLLSEKGFIIEETFVVSEGSAEDTVIDQSPGAGVALSGGSSVAITVSAKGEQND
ncbi:MAG: PASTA domain-containing protein [Candidatus Margulisiibacteriota bacterium]